MVDLQRSWSHLFSPGVKKGYPSQLRTPAHIRRKIEAEFGSTLEIFPDDNGKLLVMPVNLSKKETVKSKIALEKKLVEIKLKITEI